MGRGSTAATFVEPCSACLLVTDAGSDVDPTDGQITAGDAGHLPLDQGTEAFKRQQKQARLNEERRTLARLGERLHIPNIQALVAAYC